MNLSPSTDELHFSCLHGSDTDGDSQGSLWAQDSMIAPANDVLEEVQRLFGFCYAPNPRWRAPQPRYHATLEEVATELGCSKETARRIERLAIAKVRRWLARQGLNRDDLIG